MSFAFAYNQLTCSGATPRKPSGKFSYWNDGGRFEFSSDVLLVSSGAGGLAAECAAFETALTAWDKALLVTLDGATIIAHSPGASTGLLVRPKIEKPGSAEDSERSRKYRVTVRGRLPASAAGLSGGAELKLQVLTDAAGRPTVTLRGSYTADGGTTARARFADATIGATAAATAWLNGFGSAADFEKISEDTVEDVDSHLLDFTQVWRKRLVAETAAGGASSAYRIDSFVLSRERRGSRAAADTAARYTLSFQATAFQPAADSTALQSLWRTTIKPALVARLDAVWLSGSEWPAVGDVVIESEQVAFDVANSGVRATMQILAPTAAVLAFELVQRMKHVAAFEPKKLWDGQPNTYLLYSPGATWRAEVTATVESIGAWSVRSQDVAPPKPDGAGAARWVAIEEAMEEQTTDVGDPQAAIVRVRRAVYRFSYLLAAEPNDVASAVASSAIVYS